MTSNYSFPPSMALVVHEDGSIESRDSAIMREMQVCVATLVCHTCTQCMYMYSAF